MTSVTAHDSVSESVGTLARGTAINLGGSVFNFLGRLVFNLLVARLLGPRLLGTYFIALTLASGLGVVAVAGFDTTLIRYLARYRSDQDWGALRGTVRFAVRMVAAMGMLGCFVLIIAAPWIASWVFHKPELATPLRIAAFYGPLYALETLFLAGTQSFKVMKYKAYIGSTLDPALRILLVVGVYMLGGGLYAILTAYVSSMLVCALLSFVALRRCIPANAAAVAPAADRGELLRYAAPLFVVNILTFGVLYASSLILAHFRSAQEVGLYSVCLRLMLISGFTLTVVSQIFAPFISEIHHRGEITQLGRQLKVVTLWVVEVYVPVMLLFVVAPGLVLSIFGKDFAAAAPCLIILMMGQLINLLTGPLGLVLNMSGWTRLELWNVATVFSLQVVFAFLLIPRMGLLGAAIADSGAMIIMNLVRVAQLRWRLGIHPLSVALAKPLFAALVALGAAIPRWQHLTPAGAFRSGSLFVAMLFAYLAMLVVLGFDHHSRIAWQQLRQTISGYFSSIPLAVSTGKDVG